MYVMNENQRKIQYWEKLEELYKNLEKLLSSFDVLEQSAKELLEMFQAEKKSFQEGFVAFEKVNPWLTEEDYKEFLLLLAERNEETKKKSHKEKLKNQNSSLNYGQNYWK